MIKTDSNGKFYFLLFIVYFSLVYVVFKRLGITCIFLEIFGIPCPGCGMTRAVSCLMRFDFIGAARYNITVFFMPYIFAFICFDFKSKIHNYVTVGIACIAVLNWVVKLIICY